MIKISKYLTQKLYLIQLLGVQFKKFHTLTISILILLLLIFQNSIYKKTPSINKRIFFFLTQTLDFNIKCENVFYTNFKVKCVKL